ncbi:15179_t:CDS:2 [Entrophospora sp. SA101]|nr:15179_t:CDS:2 [Entrophospora sp. SA101]
MSKMPGILKIINNNRLSSIANVTRSYKKRSLSFINNSLKFAASNDISGKRCYQIDDIILIDGDRFNSHILG